MDRLLINCKGLIEKWILKKIIMNIPEGQKNCLSMNLPRVWLQLAKGVLQYKLSTSAASGGGRGGFSRFMKIKREISTLVRARQRVHETRVHAPTKSRTNGGRFCGDLSGVIKGPSDGTGCAGSMTNGWCVSILLIYNSIFDFNAGVTLLRMGLDIIAPIAAKATIFQTRKQINAPQWSTVTV